MIERLVELKLALIGMENPQLTLSDMVWGQVENLKCLLVQPYSVSNKFHCKSLLNPMAMSKLSSWPSRCTKYELIHFFLPPTLQRQIPGRRAIGLSRRGVSTP